MGTDWVRLLWTREKDKSVITVNNQTTPRKATPLASSGLANFLEGACPNFLQISKKTLCVPIRILKNKIIAWSLP